MFQIAEKTEEIELRYKSFRIQNFKGIKDTTIDLSSATGVNVFSLVGLNESGKTTILEAMHSFSPDSATGELMGGDDGIPYAERVPRHQISTFSGEVVVSATISLAPSDKEKVARGLREDHDLLIDVAKIPDDVVIERRQKFLHGDFVASFFCLVTQFEVRSGKQKKWRKPSLSEEVKVRQAFYAHTPDIAYFPTFIFDFPEKIYLTARGDTVSRFYKRVFQDILDYDGKGHSIDKDIVRRIRSEDRIVPWLTFFRSWIGHDDQDKVDHVIDRASAAATNLIFGRWNRIFNEDSRGKEIAIRPQITEGEIQDAAGNVTKTQEHDIYVTFQIKDGTRRFNVNDRSLGFRWFFSFMLFTQFRVARHITRPVLFLFDEPASNLHAAAQQKLIESFPEVAIGEHCLIYSTHSHYMIEPKWLEQTFIVTNQSDGLSSTVIDAVSLDDESLDIRAEKYRSFVNRHPNSTSYFQPILDRLEVVPSRFDLKRSSVVLEGKSDYFVMRYASALLGLEDTFLIPGVGAGTFGALAALSVGWGLDFLFVLDGDAAGKREGARYAREYGIDTARIATLPELCPGVTVIEDLLDNKALAIIQSKLNLAQTPNKSQICRFMQESLAKGDTIELGESFRTKSLALSASISAKLMAAK